MHYNNATAGSKFGWFFIKINSSYRLFVIKNNICPKPFIVVENFNGKIIYNISNDLLNFFLNHFY